MNPERLMTKSLRASSHGDRIARIMAAALNAVDPAKAVEHYIKRIGTRFDIGDTTFDLDAFDRVLMVGFGKASISMGEATASILGHFLSQGILITKGGMSVPIHNISIFEGSHPVPDQRSIIGAQKIVDFLSTTTEKDLVVCLISGGGSSLFTLPAPGLSLGEVQNLTNLLLRCGATINEINCLRKHLSRVKGGQLARLASPARIATLVLSDVVDDHLDVIASGPTVPDPSTYSFALQILNKYGIFGDTSVAIKDHLQQGSLGKIPETPKAGDPIFKNVQNAIVGNNFEACKAAINQAKFEGFNTLLLTTSLQGEARIVGRILASVIKQVAKTGHPIPRPAFIIAGGETTVTIHGDGLGGRNQELALGAVEDLAGLENIMLISLATDGDDGPTDAAGAVVTGETYSQALHSGLVPSAFLARNASYEFFDQLGNLLKPGMTGTNVNDLTLLIIS